MASDLADKGDIRLLRMGGLPFPISPAQRKKMANKPPLRWRMKVVFNRKYFVSRLDLSPLVTIGYKHQKRIDNVDFSKAIPAGNRTKSGL